MHLFILRHAIAEELSAQHHGKDSDRRLTPEGEKKMRRAAEGMKAIGLAFDLILTSPYARAEQTAQIVAEVFKLKDILEQSAALAPHGSPRKLIEELNEKSPGRKSILLAGHEPYLSCLISVLISGNEGVPITLKKGALCKLAVGELEYGQCATLEWLLAPKQMRAMG